MVKQRLARIVFLKHKGHRGHRVFGAKSAEFSNPGKWIGGEVLREFSCCFSSVSPSQGEAPAEPHPCRERFTDPCCSVKTLAITHGA
jgi:hypothetical protein